MTPTNSLETTVPHFRLLVADDHMLMRNMVTQNLKALGADTIDTAQDGLDAWQMIKQSVTCKMPYHVIFLDWHMPEMEGIEVLEKCRQEKSLANTAIVMLTAEQEQSNVLQAIEAGATSYIVKPVSQENFTKNLQKVTDWMIANNPDYMSMITKGAAQQSCSVKKKMKDLPNELKEELGPIVAKGVRNIFSEMFDARIVSDQHVFENAEADMLCIGRLVEGNFIIALRFLFNRNLLNPLLTNIYSPEFLKDEKIYEDAACEIVNILASQIKAHLNKHGYKLELDFPEMGLQNSNVDDAHSIMNVQFCLQENDDVFLVDLITSDSS